MSEPDRADPDSPPTIAPALRTLAMPADANPNGDIFGGWVLAQMDLAGSVPATERAQGRIATVAMDAVRFHKPVFIGDLVSMYAWIDRVGSSSITVKVETWATRQRQHAQRSRQRRRSEKPHRRHEADAGQHRDLRPEGADGTEDAELREHEVGGGVLAPGERRDRARKRHREADC